jgi:hypothetical protein
MKNNKKELNIKIGKNLIKNQVSNSSLEFDLFGKNLDT